MARQTLTFLFTIFLIFPLSTLSQNSPSPSPQPSADQISPSPVTPSPSPAIPFSPPAPPPSDLAPNSPSPALSPREDDGSSPPPSPVPEASNVVVNLEGKDQGNSGMSGKKKAGIVLGVIAGVCIVGIGTLVYRKRQQNVQRSQYSDAARREFL